MNQQLEMEKPQTHSTIESREEIKVEGLFCIEDLSLQSSQKGGSTRSSCPRPPCSSSLSPTKKFSLSNTSGTQTTIKIGKGDDYNRKRQVRVHCGVSVCLPLWERSLSPCTKHASVTRPADFMLCLPWDD